jgi:hypothetical protein
MNFMQSPDSASVMQIQPFKLQPGLLCLYKSHNPPSDWSVSKCQYVGGNHCSIHSAREAALMQPVFILRVGIALKELPPVRAWRRVCDRYRTYQVNFWRNHQHRHMFDFCCLVAAWPGLCVWPPVPNILEMRLCFICGLFTEKTARLRR